MPVLLSETREYKIVERILDKELNIRNRPAGEYRNDIDLGVPIYVRRIAEKIVSELNSESLTLHDVLAADRLAAGHADYAHKMALYCANYIHKLW